MIDEKKESRSEPTSPPPADAQPARDVAELSEEELEKVSGGLAGSCATGKHIDKATLTP